MCVHVCVTYISIYPKKKQQMQTKVGIIGKYCSQHMTFISYKSLDPHCWQP